MKKFMSAFVFASAALALSTLASQADAQTPPDNTKTQTDVTTPSDNKAQTPADTTVPPVTKTPPATTVPSDTKTQTETQTPAETKPQAETKTQTNTKTSHHARKTRVAKRGRHIKHRTHNAYLHRGYSRRGPPYGYRFGFSTYAGDPFYSDDYYDGGRCYYLHHRDFCRGRKSLDWVRGR